MTEGKLETVARFQKCGRGFVTEPCSYPAYDPFLPYGTRYRWKDLESTPICGGEIVHINGEQRKET